MNRRIAFFDFDGTITTHDTLLEFIRFSKGPVRFYFGFLVNSPWLVAMRLKLISNHQGKQKVLSWFFRKTPLTGFQEVCRRFTTDRLHRLIRPKALEEIGRLREKGFTVVVVSASPVNWLCQWAEQTGVSLLATQLETTPPGAIIRLTGRILGRNCHGAEKVRRIREAYDLSGYDEIYAYGDTKGDRPMLALATHSFYKPFR
ncbi:MAG TPA: HAD-IB family hydrolase [Puia sp.]|nr:HAD-IB family hydrolase [Puia sp.]